MGRVKILFRIFLYYYRKPEKSKDYQMNKFLVITKNFINDNEVARQEDIFTLSKENKEVETTIQDIRKRIKELNYKKQKAGK
jgi:predicted  nucleic acid-binding Zn-ribbon protein